MSSNSQKNNPAYASRKRVRRRETYVFKSDKTPRQIRTDLSVPFPGDLDLDLTSPNDRASSQFTAMPSNHDPSTQVGDTPTDEEEEECSATNGTQTDIEANADKDNHYCSSTISNIANAIDECPENNSNQTGLIDFENDCGVQSMPEFDDLNNSFDIPTSPGVSNLLSVLRQIRKGLHFIMSWERLLSYLSLYNRTPFSTYQYTIMSSAVNTASAKSITLPHYNRVKDAQQSYVTSVCLPISQVHYVPSSRNANRTPVQQTAKTVDGSCRDVRDCVRVVQASEWAKLDVFTLPMYEQLFCSDKFNNPESMNIEKSIIRLPSIRRIAFGGRLSLWVQHGHAIVPSTLHQKIEITCFKSQQHSLLPDEVRNAWTPTQTGAPVPVNRQRSETIFGKVGPLWCVGSSSSLHDTTTSSESDMTAIERALFQQLSTAPVPWSSTSSSSVRHTASNLEFLTAVRILPADFCAFLRPCQSTSQLICLFVCSFLGKGRNVASERLIWINPNTNVVAYELVACAIPKLLDKVSIFQTHHTDTTVTNQGTLGDGRKFYIYRFLLYQDGFQQKKSISDNRSVQGAYLLPLGLDQNFRQSWAAARLLSLGADGQPANELMNLLLDDLTNGVTNGIESVNAFGERCVIFLDPVALIADWPALSVLTDAMGHSADVFCSFCVFNKSKGSLGANIAYSSKLHSRRMSLMRFDARMHIVRNSGIIPETVRKQLGVKSNNGQMARAFFTEKMSADLHALTDNSIPQTNTGDKANVCHFDSFLSACAAPDHLLTGLIKDVLRLCFTELGCDRLRRRACRAICTYIATHNLPKIGSVIRYSSDGIIQHAHGVTQLDNNLTMSNLFCVLLFASQIFSQHSYTVPTSAHATCDVQPFHLPALLQDVVSMVYWLPNSKSATKKQFHYVRHSSNYHGDLMVLASKYVDAIGTYITNGGRHGSLLDKPNSHRLLELCAHSIPIFQHASNISELILESIHQNFKGWLERNSNPNSHMTAFENAIAKDWSTRLYALFTYFMHGIGNEKEAAYFGLIRMFLGEDAAILYKTTCNPHPGLQSLLQEFRERLPSLFKEPIPFMLKGRSSNPMIPESERLWTAGKVLPNTQINADIRTGVRLLRQLYAEQSSPIEDVHYYVSAKLVVCNKYAGHRRMYSHNSLHIGSVFSIVTDDSTSPCVAYAQTTNSDMVYFCALAFLSFDGRMLWAISRPMERGTGSLHRCSSRVQVVRLCVSVRPVAAIHQCDNVCKPLPDGRFAHSSTVLQGGDWKLLSARQGFPPHGG